MTTREQATFFWLAIILILCLLKRDIRHSVYGLLRQLVHPKILVPLLLYGSLLATMTVFVESLGYWDSKLLGAVLLWSIFTGFRHFLQSTDAAKHEHFFRERLLEVIGFGAFFEFFLNIRTFSLLVEILMQLGLAVLVMLQLVSNMKDETKKLGQFFGVVLALVMIWLVVSTILNLVEHREDLETHELVALFLVPIWLTLGTLPFIYLIALMAEYESLFLRMRFAVETSPRWATRAGAISALRGRLRDIRGFTGKWSREAAITGTYRGARRAVAASKSERIQRAAEEASAALRLVQNAGLKGVDENGQQLDQREFKETRDALHWLAACHMGWYQRDSANVYRRDLLDILGDFTRQGLPAEHGIVMRVSSDGQAWYAYRRTITGWVFAIGASEGPPSQWLYDGEQPPHGFPGKDKSWGKSMFETNDVNWWSL